MRGDGVHYCVHLSAACLLLLLSLRLVNAEPENGSMPLADVTLPPPPTVPAVHEQALNQIALLIALIASLRSSANMTTTNSSNDDWTVESAGSASFLQHFRELCTLLGPKPVRSQPWPKPYMSVIAFQPTDRFGCVSVLTVLSNGLYDSPENLTFHLEYAERNLRLWLRKLKGLHTNLTYSSKPTVNHHDLPAHTTYAVDGAVGSDGTTTGSSVIRWNKGHSRYDNSWIKAETGVSVSQSTMRILPALAVIAFLILCWYLFVYRRMQQRQHRARQLLSQYQSLLTGARVSAAGSGVVVVNEALPAGATRIIVCSSTFDSSLDDICHLTDEVGSTPRVVSRQETSRPESRQATSRPESRQESSSLSPNPQGTTSSPGSLPTRSSEPSPNPLPRPSEGSLPTYEEIFPPSYDSLFGTVV